MEFISSDIQRFHEEALRARPSDGAFWSICEAELGDDLIASAEKIVYGLTATQLTHDLNCDRLLNGVRMGDGLALMVLVAWANALGESARGLEIWDCFIAKFQLEETKNFLRGHLRYSKLVEPCMKKWGAMGLRVIPQWVDRYALYHTLRMNQPLSKSMVEKSGSSGPTTDASDRLCGRADKGKYQSQEFCDLVDAWKASDIDEIEQSPWITRDAADYLRELWIRPELANREKDHSVPLGDFPIDWRAEWTADRPTFEVRLNTHWDANGLPEGRFGLAIGATSIEDSQRAVEGVVKSDRRWHSVSAEDAGQPMTARTESWSRRLDDGWTQNVVVFLLDQDTFHLKRRFGFNVGRSYIVGMPAGTRIENANDVRIWESTERTWFYLRRGEWSKTTRFVKDIDGEESIVADCKGNEPIEVGIRLVRFQVDEFVVRAGFKPISGTITARQPVAGAVFRKFANVQRTEFDYCVKNLDKPALEVDCLVKLDDGTRRYARARHPLEGYTRPYLSDLPPYDQTYVVDASGRVSIRVVSDSVGTIAALDSDGRDCDSTPFSGCETVTLTFPFMEGPMRVAMGARWFILHPCARVSGWLRSINWETGEYVLESPEDELAHVVLTTMRGSQTTYERYDPDRDGDIAAAEARTYEDDMVMGRLVR